jgi:acrylyl-CoA reductase (NADPH)
MSDYRALRISEHDGEYTTELTGLSMADLPENEVLIRVRYSSINYKDALSSIGNKGVTREFPHTPGIDAAGEVVSSSVADFNEGDAVVVFGYDLGMNTAGGLAEYIRVPAKWVLPLPAGLDARAAMCYGTAGITAALSVMKLEHMGLTAPGDVLVTGATGGVGTMSAMFLSARGYQVSAVSGNKSAADLLTVLGVTSILPRETFSEEQKRPMLKPEFDAAVDCIGGITLANVLKVIRHSGSVACSGLVQSTDLPTSVLPFILRGVNLLGIDSVEVALEKKQQAWQWILENHQPEKLAHLVREISLAEAPQALQDLLAGGIQGRCVVNIDA